MLWTKQIRKQWIIFNKKNFLPINMAALTLLMSPFLKDDKIIGVYRCGWKIFRQNENKTQETHIDSYGWSVWYHLKSDARQITYHCALCDIGFTSSHCMKKHMKLPPVENSYQFSLCGEWFISRNNKAWHMNSHAGDNPYLVLYVTKNLSWETTHRDIIKFMLWITHICALCFKEFMSINHPKRHKNMNNG